MSAGRGLGKQISSCAEIADWRPPGEAPELTAGALHIWKTLFTATTAADPPLGTLSEQERRQARVIPNERSRANFVQSRAAMRRILARYAGVAPRQLRFAYGPRGKPSLQSGPRDLEFNLSHSGHLCLLALSRRAALGVDTEMIRAMRYMDAVALRMFGAEHAAYLRSIPEVERAAAFFVAWTRLEAGVKARGGGLFDGATHSPEGLSWASFVPHPGYVASIAVRGVCPPLSQWRAMCLDATHPGEV